MLHFSFVIAITLLKQSENVKAFTPQSVIMSISLLFQQVKEQLYLKPQGLCIFIFGILRFLLKPKTFAENLAVSEKNCIFAAVQARRAIYI